MASFVRSALLIAALPLGLAAQQSRRVSGTIERTTTDTTLPFPGAWVVLHRVGRGNAGPLDSIRSDAKGAYAFRYQTTRDSAVYFASSMHHGVAYFTAPFTAADVSGDAAAIVVFDTSSVPGGLSSRSHHVIVFASTDQTTRRVSEVFWLENGTAFTRVASRNGPAWRAPLPAGAKDPRVDGGSVPADGVRFANGVVEVYVPLQPGLHQLHVTYEVPVKSFPLERTVADSTDVLEVLVEEPRARIRGVPFEAQDPVTVEGHTFRRMLAHAAPAGSTFEIDVRAAPPISGRALYVMIVVAAAGGVLLLGLTRGQGRRRGLPSVAKDTPLGADQLAAAIATLDEKFAKQNDGSERARAEYSAKRAELNAQLDALLAARDDQIT